MDPKLAPTSKLLSLILRHKPETVGLRLDPEGWLSISELLRAAAAHGLDLDHDVLLRVVHENDKQRFAISADGTRIRANQGHSIAVDLGLRPATPPEFLYHGTVARFIESIRRQGLIPRQRQQVHLSADRMTASLVARRRGEPVLLTILSSEMNASGRQFRLTQNGVWLTDHVPVEFIRFPEEA